jgi:hypothetical protein
MNDVMSTTTGGWGRLTCAACDVRSTVPTPIRPVVRFWIITMMLVLAGLSTLKLR